MKAWLILCSTLLLLAIGSRAADSKPAPLIIDIHVHLFNTRYLPIREIIVSQGFPAEEGAAVEKLILALTPQSTLPRKEIFLDVAAAREEVLVSQFMASLPALPRNTIIDQLISPATPFVNTKLNFRDKNALLDFLRKGKGSSTNKPTPIELSAEQIAEILEKSPFFQDNHSTKGMPTPGPPMPLQFFGVVSAKEQVMFHGLQHTFPEVSLFVHHMMDLESTYNEQPDIPFPRQVTNMLALQNQNPGKTLTFGAFDPFRRGKAFAAMTNAYAAGVVGFKYYPPDGYRPVGNDFPRRDLAGTITNHYDRCYKDITPSDLDGWNEQFFAFCETNEIPILIHCSTGGFEAVPGYGAQMADPKYWRSVLARHPQLRVCFGHSGSPALWFGDTTDTNGMAFGATVAELCSTYENAYCDFAYWEGILSERGVAMLSDGIPKVLKTYPKLGRKLLYGSDWYMISKEIGYKDYLQQMKKVFDGINLPAPELEKLKADFFGCNAARYLRLDKLVTDTRLSPEVRAGLSSLVNRLPKGWNEPAVSADVSH